MMRIWMSYIWISTRPLIKLTMPLCLKRFEGLESEEKYSIGSSNSSLTKLNEPPIKAKLSNIDMVRSGVSQGTVLGPILFILMLNNLLDAIGSRIYSFVDDFCLLRPISNTEDIYSLQKDLSKIYHWTHRNNLEFNHNKFELVKFVNNQSF